MSCLMSSVGAPTPEFGKPTPEVLTTPLSSLGYKKQLQASRINAVSNLQSFSQAGRHGVEYRARLKPLAFVELGSPFHPVVRVVLCLQPLPSGFDRRLRGEAPVHIELVSEFNSLAFAE